MHSKAKRTTTCEFYVLRHLLRPYLGGCCSISWTMIGCGSLERPGPHTGSDRHCSHERQRSGTDGTRQTSNLRPHTRADQFKAMILTPIVIHVIYYVIENVII